MIYVENTGNYPQRVFIPREEAGKLNLRGYQFQNKQYNIDKNGQYYIYPDPGFDGITAGTINVSVPTSGGSAVLTSTTLTDNGEYHPGPGVDGYSAVTVDFNTQPYIDQGYQEGEQAGYSSGYTAGEAAGEEAQKAKLEPLTATTNGHYSNEDGYSDVYVNVESGGDYSSGYTDGMAAQKALLTSTTITDNGTYQREDGWNEVVVNVPQSTGGSAVLTSTTLTDNGEYYPDPGVDGFSAVTVDFDTQPYIDQGYQEGYTAGEAAGESAGYQNGYADGEAAGEEAQKALLTSTTITSNGTYQREDGWNEVTVNVQGGGGSVLTAGTFSNNGVFTPPQGTDGWSAITVNVPTSAGTIIPITGSTIQEYQANSTGLYSFNITTADTLHRLIISFPQTGVTHISAWYSDGNGDVEPTKLFDYSAATAWINSMTIDGGTPIAPTQYYTFGDSSWHHVVFDMTYGDAGLNFNNCTALTRIDLSEMYNTETPSFTNCEQLGEFSMPRAETIPLGAFNGCTSLSIDVHQTFPLLKDIGVSAFTESGVYSLGDVKLNSIGGEAFRNCDTLGNCNLTYVKTIGIMAFANTTFSEAYMPAVNNYSIGSSCFRTNTNLSFIYFNTDENGGTADGTIHYEAFYNCSNLTQIQVNGEVKPPVIVDSNGDPTSTPLHTISSLNGVLDLNGLGQYSRAWHDFADTYLPGWTIQEAS